MVLKEGHPLKRLLPPLCVFCLAMPGLFLTSCNESSDSARQSSRARPNSQPASKGEASRILAQSKLKLKLARLQVDEVAGAVTLYAMEKGFPHSLDALLKTRHVTARKIVDPWKRRMDYKRLSKSGFRVCSAGPDGKPGSKDDVCRTDRPQ